ncbi:phage tail-type lysozyme domain-containing protein [Lactococcus petauri]|nr:phage tail-type lysozyme domain-containing protein [Lactococcus petauri]
MVQHIKKEVPKATNNGLAAVLGTWQAEIGGIPKRAEGDFLPFPIGAGDASDALTYNNELWSSLGGREIYGASRPEAATIQQRGIGLGQYTNGRNLALQAYAKSKKKSWYDLETQLDYILRIDGDQEILKRIVAESGDVTTTTTDFVMQYERGGASGLELRISYANAWANWLMNPNGGREGETSQGTVSVLNALIGQKIGSGQCYALASWYVQTISGFTLQGMAASDIGSDNADAFQKMGWTVVLQPQTKDLKVGAIACWRTGSNSNSIYGHTAIISSVKGSSFVTYDQNWNGNQTVHLYSKKWDDSMTFVILPPQTK